MVQAGLTGGVGKEQILADSSWKRILDLKFNQMDKNKNHKVEKEELVSELVHLAGLTYKEPTFLEVNEAYEYALVEYSKETGTDV